MSAGVGNGSRTLKKKRSSCASGSGYVPSISIGFSVATTKNGGCNRYVVPATVTWSSAIASSSDDCVFGVARLISSASSTWLKIGPSTKTSSRRPSSRSRMTRVPVTSAGIKSTVNWMRLNERFTASPSERTISVLPVPGTPSMSTCPPEKNATRICSTTSLWPTTTRPIWS